MNPLVSVIVFTYNQEKLLGETLKSIVEQDFPTNQYEVLIGEDASSDHTAQVAQHYAKTYPQVQAFCHPQNLGILKNYMFLLARARGKYIMVCAGDDYWLPGKMRFQVDFMERNPQTLMIYGNFYCVKEGHFFHDTRYLPCEKFEELIFHNPICAPSTCYRREYWAQFLSEINPLQCGFTVEDWPFWIFLSAKGKIQHLNQDFCVYRVLSGSASHPEPDYTDLKHLEGFLFTHEKIFAITRLFAEKYTPEKMPLIEKKIAQHLLEIYWRNLRNYGFMPQIAKTVQHYARLYPDLFSRNQRWMLPCLKHAWLWNSALFILHHFKKAP